MTAGKITLSFTRHHSDGNVYTNPERDVEVTEAYHTLTICEIGFNSTIVEFSPTKIVTKTRIFGCTDVSAFEGSEEDMKLLYDAAAISLLIQSDSTTNAEFRKRVAEYVHQISKGIPFLMNASSILYGNRILTAVFITQLQVPVKEFDAAIERLGKLRREDLAAAVCLQHETGCKWTDIF